MKRRQFHPPRFPVSNVSDWNSFFGNVAGGHEIYFLLSKVVVHSDRVDAVSAMNLRSVSRDFRTHVDAELPALMKKVNVDLKKLYGACVTLANMDRQGLPTEPSIRAEFTSSLANAKNDVGHCYTPFYQKFGFVVADHLKKCIKEHVVGSMNLRQCGMGWVPSLANDTPRFAVSVKSFLMLSCNKICELNLGKECKCGGALGQFCFVPNGRGLIMRCSQACMDEKCVVFDPISSRPCQIASYDRRNPSASKRESNFLANLLIQTDILPPYESGSFVRRMGNERYTNHIVLKHRQLASLHSSKHVKYLLLDTDSILNDECGQVFTLQSLLGITEDHIKAAKSNVTESDKLVAKVQALTRAEMRTFAENQLLVGINSACKQASAPYLFHSLDQLDECLPGCKSLISQTVLSKLELTRVDDIYSVHVLSEPITSKLFYMIPCLLGKLLETDKLMTTLQASSFAYSFISGVCAGNDSSFSPYHMASQLNQTMVCSLNCTDRYMHIDESSIVASMHIFDYMKTADIQVNTAFERKTEEAYRRYPGLEHSCLHLFEVEIKLGEFMFTVPFSINKYDKNRTIERKIEAAAKHMCAHGMNHELGSLEVPELFLLNNLKKKPTYDYNPMAEPTRLASWLTHALPKLCILPETRAIAIDIMTNNNTMLFVECVGERSLFLGELDVATIAQAAHATR